MPNIYPIYKILLNQSNYPRLLKTIYDPPAILYARGNLQLLQKPSLAIVGSRKHSQNAQQIINSLMPQLITANLTIVSGLALGIDALVHQSCLDCEGKTIAVLGSGLNDQAIYPQTNYRLAQDILNNQGLLLSEHPINTKPLPWHFPRRNRIVSGLSLGVVIIEAALPSGSLITAKYALEQGREVFAVPGPINSLTSAGTNYLIQQGAPLISTAQDILDYLNL